MSKIAHTPEPWTVNKHDGRSIIANHNCIAICETDAIPEEEERANARLIAAAPELADFAQAFLSWHGNHFADFSPEVNAQLLCLDNEASAAIAKVTGDA